MYLAPSSPSFISAPEISDITSVLEKYQVWMSDDSLTADDVYTFITTPSASRDLFLTVLSKNVTVVTNKFATQSYVV